MGAAAVGSGQMMDLGHSLRVTLPLIAAAVADAAARIPATAAFHPTHTQRSNISAL